MSGQVGFIPSNYVSVIQVSPQCCLEFLTHCVGSLQAERAPSPERQELLEHLLDRKHGAELVCEAGGAPPPGRKKAPPPPPASTTRGTEVQLPNLNESTCQLQSCPLPSDFKQVHELIQAAKPMQLSPKNSTPAQVDAAAARGKITVTTTVDTGSETVYQMVEKVRRHTQLSHELSRVAVGVVVASLRDLLPPSASGHLDALLARLRQPLSAPRPHLDDTHDARRLRVVLAELASCKDDSQQRSWSLHEDEAVILDYLAELASILMNADPDISRHVMSREKYRDVVSLAHYYQMEVRWSIRKLLLRVFATMCNLDVAVIRLLLNSVLPAELARDMCSNANDRERLSHTAVLLTMIFCMGEPMPVTHNDHLGISFVDFIINLIEMDLISDEDEQLCDVMLNLLLSYNLQFTSAVDNLVMKTLEKWTVVKNFTEKTLLLLNREEDPVRMFDHQPEPQHSVLKLFIDLFTNEITALLFYTNDTKVLIDIVVRRLTDLSPGDKRRQQYLQLCRLVMLNTSYGDHLHLLDQIRKCFTRIFCEESELSRPDQLLVREISNQFPQYFKE
ncbi:NCK-interacting protein with SH3 domain isoform X2 [Bacillus rossius redtenbacheri]